MCGIVGVVGSKNSVAIILDGLKKLEYRGYDSAGIAVLENGQFKTVKEEGKIAQLEVALKKKPSTQKLELVTRAGQLMVVQANKTLIRMLLQKSA